MMVKGSERTALITGESTVSYNELLRQIGIYAGLYRIRKGDRVAALS